MIKGIEGQSTWVSDKMLTKLAGVLCVSSFQLLVPVNEAVLPDNSINVPSMLNYLRQNIQNDINSRFDNIMIKK